MKYIGIDPGLSGGIAIYDGYKIVTADMPTDPKSLESILRPYKLAFIAVEKVNLHKGDLKGGRAFRIVKMLENFNMIITVLKMMEFNYVEVSPSTWQSFYKQYGDSKNKKRVLKQLAEKYFPDINVTYSNCDALLLLNYIKAKDL